MVGLGSSDIFPGGLFPQISAEIADQISKVFPVERPDRFVLERGEEPELQAEPGFLAAPNLRAIGESLCCLVYLARHGCPAIGADHMEDGKVLLFLIFNIHPIVPAAIPTLVMHIVAEDRPILSHPVAAA